MLEGKQRAVDQLSRAASLSATQVGNDLRVTLTNLTGHKLMTGYPEGRRIWLNIVWRDGGGAVVHEDGAYGPLPRAAVLDLEGVSHQPESILDLENTVVIEAEPGMDQQWAAQLSSLGYPDAMVLGYDRLTDAPYHTLGELRTSDPGEEFHTFHFVLNNVMTHDNRIPPWGMRYDDARLRNALPVPYDQFGNPGAGGVYNHWVEHDFDIPASAESAEVRLFYQQTTWEYIQFLWLENDQQGAFLGQEGVNLLDAWLNTGMAAPVEMAFTSAAVTGIVTGVPGETSHQHIPAEQMHADWDASNLEIDLTYTPACDATDHTVYYGDLSGVASYTYTGAACFVGATGTASFDPGSGSYFFLVVANDGSEEGSYGKYDFAGTSDERDEAVGLPACDYPRNLGGVVCE
jgi:hypothetical protein